MTSDDDSKKMVGWRCTEPGAGSAQGRAPDVPDDAAGSAQGQSEINSLSEGTPAPLSTISEGSEEPSDEYEQGEKGCRQSRRSRSRFDRQKRLEMEAELEAEGANDECEEEASLEKRALQKVFGLKQHRAGGLEDGSEFWPLGGRGVA